MGWKGKVACSIYPCLQEAGTPPVLSSWHLALFFLGPEVFWHWPYHSSKENDSNKNCTHLNCNVIWVQISFISKR